MYLSLSATALDFCRTENVGTFKDLLVKKLNNLNMNKKECLIECGRIYEPVCISNGKYRALAPNKCMLDTLNCVLGNIGKTYYKKYIF